MPGLPNLVVVGGSYVGLKTAETLATAFHTTHRVLLVEKNSHFQHLFAFPRFAVTSTGFDTRKAFIPFKPGAFSTCPPGSGRVVQAKVVDISSTSVKLDRQVDVDGVQVQELPFEYLVLATGTKLTPPSTLPGSEKLEGVAWLHEHVEKIKKSKNICVIGGGAVGVQMSTDIKEIYPDKRVVLVHSRQNVMNRFHPKLHGIIAERAKELDIELVLGSRVKLPEGGFPTDGSTFDVQLVDGRKLENFDFAIICTGQTPHSEIMKTLSAEVVDQSGFIRTKPTLQIADDKLPHVFAVGDVAASGAPKAARPGLVQAELVAKNIAALRNGSALEDYKFDPAAIHLTLGVEKNVLFRNSAEAGGEPGFKMQDNGRLDMGIDDVWKRRGGGDDFHL